MLAYVSSANIACGLHAGDALVMQQTMQLALQAGAAVGAHPGYPDLQGFGRRAMVLTPEEVEAVVLYQVGALAGFAQAQRAELSHVKPHGALYNQAAKDRSLAAAIARGVARFSKNLILVGLAGSCLVEMGTAAGLRAAAEGFADRTYQPDGMLAPRSQPGALFVDPEQAAAQALRLVQTGILITTGSQSAILPVETICLHGDTPHALSFAAAVRSTLHQAGVQVARL